MKPTQLLDAFRNIRKEIVAFISIVVIGLMAALAFLSIVYSSATLKKDAIHFFNTQNLWDLEVTSTLLMTNEDLGVIRALPGVEKAEPVFQIDSRLHTESGNTTISVISLPEEISRPILCDGRLPENVKECAIEKNLADDLGLAIGSHIELNYDLIMEIDPLAESNFVITGIFYTPDHFSYMVPVTPYILVKEECFNREGLDGAFMKTRISVTNTPDDRYSDEYMTAIRSVIEALEDVAGERSAARIQGLQRNFDEKIRSAEAELENAREAIRLNRQKIEEGWRQLEEAEQKLAGMKLQLDGTGALIAQGRQILNAAREHLENGDLSEWAYEQYGYSYDDVLELFRTIEERFLSAFNNWIFAGEEYLDGLTQYQNGLKLLEDGERELAEGEKKLRDAEEELRAAKEKRGEIGDCRWIVLDNNSNPGFIYAAANADKLSSLSMSFSSIFLVVGVLVIYATISRMVEEQRRLIGVNKALGLFNREILAKYLLFACSAVILGVGLGILLAWLPVQRAVLRSYEAHLNYGVGSRSFLLRETAIVAVGSVAISVVAVYMGCSHLLRQSALVLIQGANSDTKPRKKAHNSSKKSLFFRLIFRNMMTDRKRVFVTIISIAGGCVLMVVGFYLRYGISGVPDRQFGGIMTYDAEVFYDAGENANAASVIETVLKENRLQYVNVRKEAGVFEIDGTMNAMTMIVAEKEALKGYYSLYDIDHEKAMELPDDGMLVPRRFREYFGIDVGQSVTVYDAGLNHRDVTVTGVFENYYGQLFFLSPDGYEEAMESTPACNCFFVKTDGMTLSELQRKLDGVDGLSSVKDAAAERTMIEQFTSSLNFVVYFMLFIAGVMACFIVMNFTMTFIQRKKGELTIMRINGFSSGECIRYVAVDLVVTTFVGTAVGLLIGAFMGERILRVTETPYIQMIREPRLESFLFAALITFVFSAITNSIALRRIKYLKLSDVV